MDINDIDLSEFKLIENDSLFPNRYYINENGIIYSNSRKGTIIKQRKDRCGYMVVQLYLKNPGEFKTLLVHKLVAETFIGPPPEDMIDPTIDHKDYNRENNHVSNLQWMDRSDNCSNRKNGCSGENNGRAKLTEDQVKKICKMINKGISDKEIANKYEVSHATISNIRRGKNWNYLTKDLLKAI